MPALNFKVFTDKILSGEKCQTIRVKRKYPIKRGDTLYLYKGMRTRKCRKLGEAICVKVIPVKFGLIDLFDDGAELSFAIYQKNSGKQWPLEWVRGLARDDGFDSVEEFSAFFIRNCKIKPNQSPKEFDIISWHAFEGAYPD
jgi:hypothetical protein